MRKLMFMAFFCAAVQSLAQVNVQLHYDFGRKLYKAAEPERPNVTSTVEMFRPDKWGNTYFFVDFDYYSSGVGGAYWEVSRELTLADAGKGSSFAAHVEYDGGLSITKSNYATRFQPAALVGGAWNWHSEDFSKTFSLQLLYKQYFRQTVGDQRTDALASFQITPVWSLTFAHGKLTFSGFADLWYGFIPDWKSDGEQKKGLAFCTEPQLWYNVAEHLSIGTEWEVSDNFIYAADGTKFVVNPTLALKWTF